MMIRLILVAFIFGLQITKTHRTLAMIPMTPTPTSKHPLTRKSNGNSMILKLYLRKQEMDYNKPTLVLV